MSYKRNQTRYSKKKIKINKFNMKKLKRFSQKYKDNPVKFVEDFLGVKLYTYQKAWIKTISNIKNIRNLF